MTNQTCHNAGIAASVIVAASLAAIPVIGLISLYGWWGLPRLLGFGLSIWFLVKHASFEQIKPETNAQTDTREAKRFAVIFLGSMLLVIGWIIL